jgi:hypothetical protein
VTDEQKRLVAVGIFAAAVGAAAGYFVQKAYFADDDRPPIIVRGGSLYFDHKTDRRTANWQRVNPNVKKEWEGVQGGGKPVNYFAAYFVGGSGACTPTETEEVTVNLDHDSDPTTTTRQYSIKIVNRRPNVSSTIDMDTNGTDLTRLIADSGGTLESVVIGTAKCDTPTALYLEPIK